jgi:hypothetical protein
VDGIDVAYTVAVNAMRDLEISVVAPDGTPAIVRPQGDTNHSGTTMERRTTHALDGKAAAGTWHITLRDAGGQNGAGAKGGLLAIHYTGGHAPIVTSAAYESAPHDLGMTSHVDEVDFSAATPPGTSIVVRLRTGSSADELMAQPWSDPVTSGQPPIVGAGQLVQYRVELTSDGDHSPSFDWIELVYRATS